MQPEVTAYVNDERYARLSVFLREARADVLPAAGEADAELTSILLREARLLDERRYDDWLALFAGECLYWVPSRYEPGDPRSETAIYLDDRRRLGDRIAAIRSGFLHAQTPPSRTRRMLSNVECWTRPDGGFGARANVVIWEQRKGETRARPGWQAYEIVRGESGRLAIATKIVLLLDCDSPQGNYAFIL